MKLFVELLFSLFIPATLTYSDILWQLINQLCEFGMGLFVCLTNDRLMEDNSLKTVIMFQLRLIGGGGA